MDNIIISGSDVLKIVSLANDNILTALHRGYEASRIEFCIDAPVVFDGKAELVIAVKYRKTSKPKRKIIVATLNIENWGGDAAANHPVLAIAGNLWFMGIETP